MTSGEVIVSPLIISRMLTRVALRRELRAVFDAFFSSDGSDIVFHRIADYDLAEYRKAFDVPDAGGCDCSFADLQRAAYAHGEIAIGVRRTGQEGKPGGGVQLNPAHDGRLKLSQNDEIIVLTTVR